AEVIEDQRLVEAAAARDRTRGRADNAFLAQGLQRRRDDPRPRFLAALVCRGRKASRHRVNARAYGPCRTPSIAARSSTLTRRTHRTTPSAARMHTPAGVADGGNGRR